jgi:DNA polymerase-3 subunit beta
MSLTQPDVHPKSEIQTMKLHLERADLLQALAHVQGVVERRHTIPILSNVLLEAGQDGLSLTATDLDIAVVEQVAAKVEKTGATTVPAHTLYEIVRKLPDGAEIEISTAAGEPRLHVRAGRSAFQLACLPKEEFPVMTVGEMGHRFQMGCDSLKRILNKTRFAVSTEETRYYLNGIYFHAVPDAAVPSLRAVATDGHRLARVDMPLPQGAAGMPGVIVPRKTVNELHKLLEANGGEVQVALSETKIRFAFDNVVLVSKLIDGAFPDYERVIPTNNDKMMEVDGATFARAVDRVSTIATEKSRAVKLSLDKDRMVLSAASPEQGAASEEISVTYSSEPMEIGFNAKYLLDIAGQIEGESAKFLLADSASPTVVRDQGDDSALFVLMPMRV